MTALVLSAGGMFAAYQAGAWKGLAARGFRPDLVVGASAGALNAWAIAGGITPERLLSQWLDPDVGKLAAFRLLQPLWRGVLDARPLYAQIERLWGETRPTMPVGVVATEIPALKPRLFRDGEITWRHLAASCAVLTCYPQIRIDGRLYSDGGLLGALPLWAGEAMGATRIVAVNALTVLPSRIVRGAVRGLRSVARRPPGTQVPVRTIAPGGPLGPLRDGLFWRREAVELWIAQGEADAARVSLE